MSISGRVFESLTYGSLKFEVNVRGKDADDVMQKISAILAEARGLRTATADQLHLAKGLIDAS